VPINDKLLYVVVLFESKGESLKWPECGMRVKLNIYESQSEEQDSLIREV